MTIYYLPDTMLDALTYIDIVQFAQELTAVRYNNVLFINAETGTQRV